ncbi:hypothetical protein [Fulvivirga sp.]|uniref:hypothetical protein n=1 Tax=Fulvivirga sp. TaxID=1931237 RepID=UPI0032EF3C4D
MIESSNKLQFHYLFKDDSHSIDASLRNECEKELLHLFKDVAESLRLDIRLETLPSQEGGFKDVWKFLGKNSVQITLIISITTIVLSRFPAENEELTKLQIENLKLDNELKRKELDKLNLEFLQEDKDLDDDKLKDSVELVNTNYKISWRKSNLYKKLQNYRKVEAIEIQRFNNEIPINPPRHIPRKGFHNFILKSDDLPDLIITKAEIDVISPTIKPGKFRWKGFYNTEIITFEMNDFAFKNQVLHGDIHFSNTFSIEVEMTQKRKIDQDGSVKVTNTYVNRVIATIEYGKRTEFNY